LAAVKSAAQMQAKSRFTLILGYEFMLIVEDPTMAIKVLFVPLL